MRNLYPQVTPPFVGSNGNKQANKQTNLMHLISRSPRGLYNKSKLCLTIFRDLEGRRKKKRKENSIIIIVRKNRSSSRTCFVLPPVRSPACLPACLARYHYQSESSESLIRTFFFYPQTCQPCYYLSIEVKKADNFTIRCA